MYLNFQSIKNPKLGSFSVGHVYVDDRKASEDFQNSLSGGGPFLVENCRLNVKSAARIESSNGYMAFVAQANFNDGGSDEVQGIVSFLVD